MPPLHDLELYLQLVRVALEGLKLLVDLIQALWAASGRSSAGTAAGEGESPSSSRNARGPGALGGTLAAGASGADQLAAFKPHPSSKGVLRALK